MNQFATEPPLLQTRECLLQNSDFNMAGYEFETVRDMPVVSDCHPVERDTFQAPAPPSDRVGVTGVRVGAAGAGTIESVCCREVPVNLDHLMVGLGCITMHRAFRMLCGEKEV